MLCDVSPDIIIVCADYLNLTTVCILQIVTDPKCGCFDTESDDTLVLLVHVACSELALFLHILPFLHIFSLARHFLYCLSIWKE